MDLNLADKNVFVTGSSRGIGYAIAEGFLSEGAKVVINSSDKIGLDVSREKLAKKFGENNIYSYTGDLTKKTEIKNSIKFIKENIGELDILVANIGSGKSLGDSNSKEERERMKKINFDSSVMVADESIKIFNKKGGSIIFISSIAGIEKIGAPVGYEAAKKELIKYTKILSNKIAGKGIRVNTVAPGNIKFPGGRWEEIIKENPKELEFVYDEVPMSRFGTPEEVANIVVFLSSHRASFVTGACWVADGGQLKNIIYD